MIVDQDVVPEEQPVAIVVEEAGVAHDHSGGAGLRVLVAVVLADPGHVQVELAVAGGVAVVDVDRPRLSYLADR